MLEDVQIKKVSGDEVVVTGRSFRMHGRRGKSYASRTGFRCSFRRVESEIIISESGLFERDAQAIRDMVNAQKTTLFGVVQ